MQRPASPGALPQSDRATARSLAEHTASALTAVALLTLVFIVGFLVTHAASSPPLASAMLAIYAGLIASSLVLVRQWKKDWTARRAGQAGAAHMALRDPVTQLLNAEGFADALARHARQEGDPEDSLAILCVSLGRLKDIYDRLGESCGDEVLRDLGARLVSAFGDKAPVGRVGEDMLAVFHPASSGIKLALVGGQINRLMDLPVATPGGDVILPSTIGVNFVDMPVTAPRDAIRQARLANSAARTSGNGLAFFEASLDHAQRLQLELEIELRQALQAGELQMVYQPQINETGVTIGVEALMRWPHPTRGQISPAVFVPIAEAAGLGEALGRFAIDRAFADSALWPGLRIAINVSPVQLRSATFIASVKALLARHGVKANGFEFEITEGVLLQADATVMGHLEQLRRMGFQIALDDFGTGYSSLSYLGRFPIDKIKIDRAFVTPLGLRSDAASIIRAISDLSEALGIKVLAEGVETRSQLDILRAEGCNQAQGYLIGRPMEPGQITDLIHAAASDTHSARAA